ncbi:tetratricopeptide repeat protein [Jeongeupia wiesaeckerbachi]|uniref:tetratricopeptide repeat protein n=1 Tax=Jeongeupia wiesaeckerbachi TaxID=3051218 RepID=UPI003D8011C1
MTPSDTLNDIEQIVFSDPTTAKRWCRPLLARARTEHDVETLVRAATLLSLIEDQLGERIEGSILLAEALACCQMYGLSHLEPAVQERLGRDNYTGGDYRLALLHWSQCARLCGDDLLHARTLTLSLIGLGQVCSAYGAIEQAVTFHRAATRQLAGSDDVHLIAKVRISLGWDLHVLGREDEARTILVEALALCRVRQFEHFQAELLLRLAEIDTEQNDDEAAEQKLEEALSLLVFTPSHWCETQVLGLLARLRHRNGRPDLAISMIQRALHIAEVDGMRHVEARLLTDLIGYAEADGNTALIEVQQLRLTALSSALDASIGSGEVPDLSQLRDLLTTYA